MIESDLSWMGVLRQTFKNYTSKVVFCNKKLSRYSDDENITLNALVKEKIDFLKMDIERCETDVLLGGMSILSIGINTKCVI